MSFRVAFDVDGVFADMESALHALTVASQGAPLSIRPVALSAEPRAKLTPAQLRRAWRCVRRTHNFWETLDELEPRALAKLHTVSRDRRWQVVFLTQRPSTPGDHPQMQTQRWLERHGFPNASVLVVPGARGKLAAALHLNFIVDDVPRYCLDAKLESHATPCLVWRSGESQLPPGTRRLGIEVFHDVGGCLEYLVSRDGAPERTPGFAARIRHRLGFGPRTSI